MSAFLLYIVQKKQTIESERVQELSPNNYKKAMKPGDVMKFKLKPLAYLVMLAISNAVAPAYAVDEIPLPIESAYPDALKDQLPDFEHAAGKGVTFEGPGSTFTGTTPPAPTLDVNTTEKNTLINWGGRGFDVGADATVNFNPGVSGTSVLNYDSTGSMSIVNGAVNANGAKLFLVNPDGISDTSGSFTALIANDAENVTLGTDGRLRIKNAGDRIYGPVSGQVDTSQDISVDLVGGSSGNSSNMILGGDNTRINISNPSSGANLISNTKFAANKTTISASEQSSASLRLENTSGGNLTINNFKDTIVSGKTNLDGVTVNNPSALSTFSSDSATGSLRNIDVNNGSVDLTQTGGVLIIDGMKHDSYIGNFEASVSGGAVLDIRNSVINLNSDGGLEDSDDLPAGVEDQEIDNSALFSTDTGGGTVSLTNSAIIAEGSIYFEDNLKVGTLNLTNTDLLVPEGNVMVTPGTKIIMENGFALDSDFNPNGFTRGVIVIDATKVEGTIDSGKQYFLPDDDYGEYSSDKQIVLGFNQIKASGGGAMENRQEFSDVASQPGAPSDIPSTGGGQEEDPPVIDIPEIPDDGSNPGNPGTDPGNGGEPDPGADPGDGGDTDPGDGGETDPGTEPGDGGGTDPGTEPGNGGDTDPGTEPGNGGGTDPGTEPGDGGETDPGTGPGDGGETDPGTDPGNGGGTDPGTEPGDGGDTDPGTDPGNGGETDPGTEPGNGGDTDPGTEPGNGGETDPGTDPGNGGGTDPGTEPGDGGDTDPGTEPGNGGETDPGTDPGNGGGTDPGTEPGDGGDTDPGTEPGNGGETDPGTEPGNGGETDPGTGPGTGGDTDPGTDPGNGGGTDPGTEPGDGGDTDPGTDPGNGGETDPGTEPGNGGETDPGNGGGTDPGTEPGDGGDTDPGTEPGNGGETDPGTEPGNGGETDPGTEPGNGGGTDPGTEPGDGDETDPGTEPGDGGGTEPGNGGETDPGTQPGNGGETEPGTEPGDGGGTNPGAEPGEGGSTTPGDNNPDNPGSGSGGNESGNPATPPGSGSEGGVGGNNPDEDPSQGEADDNQDILNPEESDPLIDELLEPSEESDLLLDETEEECESSEGGREESCESEVAN